MGVKVLKFLKDTLLCSTICVLFKLNIGYLYSTLCSLSRWFPLTLYWKEGMGTASSLSSMLYKIWMILYAVHADILQIEEKQYIGKWLTLEHINSLLWWHCCDLLLFWVTHTHGICSCFIDGLIEHLTWPVWGWQRFTSIWWRPVLKTTCKCSKFSLLNLHPQTCILKYTVPWREGNAPWVYEISM